MYDRTKKPPFLDHHRSCTCTSITFVSAGPVVQYCMQQQIRFEDIFFILLLCRSVEEEVHC
jgi:hypothetical protein